MSILPTITDHSATLSDQITISFKGENLGDGVRDTLVKIEDKQLCWICWEDKENFINELNEVIQKYRI